MEYLNRRARFSPHPPGGAPYRGGIDRGGAGLTACLRISARPGRRIEGRGDPDPAMRSAALSWSGATSGPVCGGWDR